MAYNTTTERLLNRLAQRSQIGACGVIQIDDTDEHTGPFSAITALDTAVIDTSECTTNIEDAAATISIPTGVTIFGSFTSIELDSGDILAYYTC